MSHVYILTQTEYKHWQDYENDENRHVAVLNVYTTAKAANDAAKGWVQDHFSDADNEVNKDEDGCDTWTCEVKEDEQDHVVISVVKKALLGEPEDSEEEEGLEESGEEEEETGQDNGSNEAQQPPSKRVRKA